MNSRVRTNNLTVLLYFYCCVNALHHFVNMAAKSSFKIQDQASRASRFAIFDFQKLIFRILDFLKTLLVCGILL